MKPCSFDFKTAPSRLRGSMLSSGEFLEMVSHLLNARELVTTAASWDFTGGSQFSVLLPGFNPSPCMAET